jgi:hypothetical protein
MGPEGKMPLVGVKDDKCTLLKMFRNKKGGGEET